MIGIFWEFIEPSLDKLVVISRISDIIPTTVLYFINAFAETNCRWMFKEDDTSVSIP